MVFIYICKKQKDIDGRTLLREALRDYNTASGLNLTDDELAALVIDEGTHGKPRFPQLEGVHFSVSHSGELWACMMCGFEVGLDIEDPTRRGGTTRFNCVEIARRFFAADERDYVEFGAQDERESAESVAQDGRESAESVTRTDGAARRFLEIWTKKEAFIKYTGRGLGAGLRNFSVLSGCSDVGFGKLDIGGVVGAYCCALTDIPNISSDIQTLLKFQ
jgi:4'-phosphopantetheinyl transferase